MIKLSRIIITSICLVSAVYTSAQTQFYVEGLGRAQIANDALKGNVLASDTIGGKKQIERKNTGGYTLLDLGFNIEKKDKFYLNTILRGRNSFGLFWGEGTTFEFRKITFGGLIGTGVKYELGDIYVEMSPYTLFMPEADYSKYESNLFGLRRDILKYENFLDGNSRFQQGFKADGTLLFTKGIEKLHLAGFATRTQEITQLGDPDIIMAGASVKAMQGKFGTLGVNLVSLFDLPVATNVEELSATTLTANINPSIKVNNKLIIGIDAEVGGSNYSSAFTGTVPQKLSFSGYLVDAKAKLEMKKYKTVFYAGYKNVDASFRAPAAQTRRINDNQSSQVFPTNAVDVAGAKVLRSTLLFDRFTQENMYRQGISKTLQSFNPAFNNVNPYGAATPNRKGFVVDVIKGTSKDALSFDLHAQLLSEIDADNTTNASLRKFTSITSGVLVNISKIADFKKDVNVSFGYQMENTTRTGNESVDLVSSVIDVAASAEVANDFDLMFGLKHYAVDGNEYTSTINQVNYTREIFTPRAYNTSELVLSMGARLRFTEKSALTVTYSILDSANLLSSSSDDYKWNQLFVNYTMKF